LKEELSLKKTDHIKKLYKDQKCYTVKPKSAKKLKQVLVMSDFAEGKLKNKNNKITIVNMKDQMFNKDLKLAKDFEKKINQKIE
jgi:hypothetical protein